MKSLRAPASVMALAAVFTAAAVAQQPPLYPRTDDHRAWNKPVEPLRLIGPIYYIGTFDLASYLIATPAGHIVMDSGLEADAAQLKSSIEKLGFKVSDVRILLNTQAHFDHAAGLAELKRASGARMLASKADAAILEAGGKDDPVFGDSLPFTPVKVDQVIEDGERVTLGNVSLTAQLTPGHSPGTTTWTMSVQESGRSLSVVFAGSTSIPNPDMPLTNNTRYPSVADDYRRTFAFLKSLKPDVFLTQHASAFNFHDKVRRLKAGEKPHPFIDPEGYSRWLTGSERSFLSRLTAK